MTKRPRTKPAQALDLAEIRRLAFAKDAASWQRFPPLLKNHPNDATLTRLAGIKAYHIGDWRGAIALLDSARALGDEDAEALLFLMRAHFNMQEPEQAAAAARQLLACAPDDRTALRVLGRIHHQNGETEAAFACWRRASDLAPEDSEAALQVARFAARLHMLPTAAEYAARVADGTPHRSEALQIQANALLGLGQIAAFLDMLPNYFALARPQALDALQQMAPQAPVEQMATALARLREAFPDDEELDAWCDAEARGWRRQGLTREMARDVAGSAACFRATRTLWPDNPDAAAGLARLSNAHLAAMRAAFGQDRYDEATRAANAALAVDPALHEAHFTLGHIRLLRNDPEGALVPLAAAVARHGQNAGYWLDQARAMECVGQDEGAARASRHVLELTADAASEAAAESRARLARLHERALLLGRDALAAGDLDGAWEQYLAAAVANAEDPATLSLRTKVLDELHDEVVMLYKEQSADVIDIAEQYLRKDPEHRNVLLMLGRTLMRGTQYQRALAVWERLLVLDPEEAHFQLQVARCCAWLHLPDRGLIAAAAALRIDPNLAEAIRLFARFRGE